MPRAANRRLSVASGGLAGFALRFKVARDAFLLPDGTQGYAGRKPRLSFVLLLLRIEWLLRRTCKYFRWERVGNGGEARASQAGPLGRASLLGVSLMGRPADAPSQLTCAHGPFPCSSRTLSSAEVAEVWKLGADVADSRPPSPDGKRGSIRP